MTSAPFPDRPRVDAREKVLGQAQYAADVAVPGLLYAMLVPATIAKGSVRSVPVDAAMRVAGVVRVLTASDFPPPPAGGAGGPPPPPTITDQIAYRGQPVALVVAETLEAAIEGAEAIRPTYAAMAFVATIEGDGVEPQPVEPSTGGDADAAMARAVTRHEAEYVSPAQHHNPIEMLSTTAVWEGGVLTVYEGTQGSNMAKGALMRTLRLSADQVVVKSPQIGGGFGQKGGAQRQTAIVARAAMLLGRPVKLVVPRGQIFHNATFRPKNRHRIEIGADAEGRMIAVRYDADQQQSRQGQFPPAYHESPPMMYGIADYHGTAANLRIDTQAPGYMRAPTPHPSSFAFDSAVDEMAVKLGIDPLAFRLKHRATRDPIDDKPFSTHFLHECLTEGARRFGWDKRPLAAGATVRPDGTQVGWGVGCGAYPANVHPTIATLRIGADGTTRFAAAGHEMGQGIRSTIEQVLVRELAIDPAGLEIAIGDTSVAPQHVTAGSWGTASAVIAAERAAASAKAAMADLLAGRTPPAGNLHRQLATVRRPSIQVEVTTTGPGQGAKEVERLRQGGMAVSGPVYPQFTSFSYIAHFVEVHVEPRTRRIRVPRVVSVADCGRVISPRTAASQVRGGVVWAISACLREATEVDPRYGGWLNNDLADYVVAVNADIGEIDVAFVDQPDNMFNALGAKGLGEVAMTGCAAAVANAVYHATGKRLREMPFRIENLL
ncbi:xanthine dehydrogenase family protein molybdopterin-binding subunit [Sphingomonas baiyangensis]|uniref:Xanthine dehydrogenase family protein molybdopterin-binding subunit n=1 Tax=Sphingomonas baiyangensis TaxID=2572576 RepID=A0A4U1L4Y2_9SPHN|nr:xanthine dehydrogenase family protein molybdopterin-binding subunit [Sphingomonas baiyangensis]TKD51614.1 xanthine dehydrogenase family protein molybdopterin-binding subunit [Sphingomonas baiyangensis]